VSLSDDATVRTAASAIAATLTMALADPHARSILLTRDEAILALGIAEGVVEQIDREGQP
jgi:hypothetical protein